MGGINMMLTIISLILIVSAVLCADNDTEPCPYWRGFHSPWAVNGLWYAEGEPPNGRWYDGYPENTGKRRDPLNGLNFTRSVCARSATKVFTRPGAHTTVALHLTNEPSWNRHPRRDIVLSDIEEAIKASLDLFGDHAGNESHPLAVHITVADVVQQDWEADPNIEIFFDEGILFNTWGYTWGMASPCEMVIGFQDRNFSTQPSVKTKKDVVKNLYHCVQQWHHAHLKWYPRPWWHESIARFMDGVLWPATEELIPERTSSSYFFPRYPEEYEGSVMLGLGETAGAIWWHWLHNNGWSPASISQWMRSRPMQEPGGWGRFCDDDLKAFTEDEEGMAALFHGFVRAVVSDAITYPSTGEPIRVLKTFGEPWHDVEWLIDAPLQFRLGEQRDVMDETWLPGETVAPWEVMRLHLFIAPAQVLEVSLGHKDYVLDTWRPSDGELYLDRVANASVYRDIHWSYRRVGEKNLTVVGEGGDAKIARIEVPSAAAAGIEGKEEPGVEYEFFVSCTGRFQHLAPVRFMMKRAA